MVLGRTTEARSVSVTKTASSAAITAAAGTFSQDDVGRTITGTGIPASTTVLSVASGTAATMSANATSAGSVTAALGSAASSSAGYIGWSPETAAEAASYTVAANNAGTASPDRITDTSTAVSVGRRSRS